MRTYRIGIDCRLAGHSHAGIGRYIVELVKRVTKHTQVQWLLFYSHKDQVQQLFPHGEPPAHCSLVYAPVKHYTVTEQIQMNSIFTRESLDLLHVPHFNIPVLYSRPLVITIHDLLWHQHKGSSVTTLPRWKYWIKYGFYRFVTRVAVHKAHTVFVPTNTVRSVLRKYFPAMASKVVVTPEGISDELLQHTSKLKTLATKPNTLLYVGSLYPHKNVSLLLHALQQLPAYRLTIVSARTVFKEKLQSEATALGLSDRVQFLSDIDDAELAKLYKTSTALIQPSFSEGFGLTGLEAIAFKTPVLASKIPVFKEVYQDAALYFDPHSVDDFCTVLQTLHTKDVMKSLQNAATTVLKKNNWDDLANRTYLSYHRAVKTKHAET